MKQVITITLIVTALSIFSSASAQSGASTSTTVTNTTVELPSVPATNKASPATETTTTSVTTTTTTPSDTDSKLVTAVYAQYAKEAALIGTSLTVKCVNGFVTVTGTVTAQSQADQAVIAAKKVPGVKGATSEINVTTNPGNGNLSKAPNY